MTFEDVRKKEKEDLRTLLRTPEGRDFLKRFFHEGRVFVSTHHSESREAAYREGARSLALRYFQEVVEIAPELVGFFASMPELGFDKNEDS